MTWVHSSTGVRLPIQEIAQALRALEQATGQRVLLCVDGVHGFGAVDVDLPDLGCDFLSAGTHKWLFGPRGTGILWGRNFGPLTELIPSFSGPGNGARLSPGGYHSFEHRWALDQAFAFHQRIGRAAVVQRTVDQATQLKEGLAVIGADQVRVVTPLDPEVSAGIVCLDVAGLRPATASAGCVAARQGIVAERDAVRHVVPASRPVHRDQSRAGRRAVEADSARCDAAIGGRGARPPGPSVETTRRAQRAIGGRGARAARPEPRNHTSRTGVVSRLVAGAPRTSTTDVGS